jgi:hypothetical protein
VPEPGEGHGIRTEQRLCASGGRDVWAGGGEGEADETPVRKSFDFRPERCDVQCIGDGERRDAVLFRLFGQRRVFDLSPSFWTGLPRATRNGVAGLWCMRPPTYFY